MAFDISTAQSTSERPQRVGFNINDASRVDDELIVDEDVKRESQGKNPIGFFEAMSRLDVTEHIPFSPERDIKSILLANSIYRLRGQDIEEEPHEVGVSPVVRGTTRTVLNMMMPFGGELTDELFTTDEMRVSKYIKKTTEERERGFTTGAKIGLGITTMIPYALEFLTTGGVYKAGKIASQGVIRKAMKAGAKRTIPRKLTGWMGGSVARSGVTVSRAVGQYGMNRVGSYLVPTEEGIQIAKESTEKPFTSAYKALGSHVIENMSEVAGGTLSKGAKALVPKKMASALVKAFKKIHPSEKIQKLFTKAGYNGFLEEMGEERLGDLLRAVTGVDDFGEDNVLDSIIASIPRGEDLLVEAGVLSIPSMASGVFGHALKVSERRAKKKAIKQALLDEGVQEKEAEEVIKLYEAETKRLAEEGRIEVDENVEDVPNQRPIDIEAPVQPEEETRIGQMANGEYGVFDKKTGDLLESFKTEEEAKQYKPQTQIKMQKEVPLNAEDIELKNKFKGYKVANKDKVTGEVFAYDLGEENVYNHADIMQKHKMNPDNIITGFVDREGNFVTQYEEDAQATQQAHAEKQAVEEALLKEAAKYDTVEEFYEAQEKVYHGTNENFSANEFDIAKSGTGAWRDIEKKIEGLSKAIYFTSSESHAKEFGKNIIEAKIKFINPLLVDGKKDVLDYQEEIGDDRDIDDFINSFGNLYGVLDADWYFDNLVEVAKKNGHDGVIVDFKDLPIDSRGKKAGKVFIVTNPETIKTKSQLTSIWQQAHAEKQAVSEKPKKQTIQLGERIKTLKKAYIAGRAFKKKEVEAAQKVYKGLIKESGLPQDKQARLLQRLTRVTSEKTLNKQTQLLKETIEDLQQEVKKRDTWNDIKRELKYTKPVKKGQRRVEKYDYENSKVLRELRKLIKTTKTDAQNMLDTMSDVGGELDLMKARILSLKANAGKASAELYAQVLKDIQRIKQEGKQAKDESDLVKRIDRELRVTDALTSMQRIKADKKTIKTKVGNAYRSGFGNIWTFFNSMFGKKFADENNTELAESERNTATFKQTKRITDAFERIYNGRSIYEVFAEMAKDEYTLYDKDGDIKEFDRFAILGIYNSLKNTKKREDYYWAYGEAQINNLVARLTPQEIELADYLQSIVQEYRDVFNKHHIERTGRDMGFVENYWPERSEYLEDVFDDIRRQGETPRAERERVKNRVVPVPSNAWATTQRHIAQGEHVRHVSREYEKLKRLFTNKSVRSQIKYKYGESVYNTLMKQIDNLSLNKRVAQIDAISGVVQHAVNNWVTAKVAFNPSTLVRQLVSTGNYMEDMPVGAWTKGFYQGVTNPKETFDYMWQNAPFLETRFNRGYSEAINEAIKDADLLKSKWSEYRKFLTVFSRVGDVTAIIYGGYPLVKHLESQGMSRKEAFKVFEQATLRAQQSSLSSSRSDLQNERNAWVRLFLAFKNTPTQYLRKIVDANIMYMNKDINFQDYAKRMTIYAVVQPILFSLAGAAVREGFKSLGRLFGGQEDELDEEKIWKDILVQLVVNPVNAVPFIDDAITTAMRFITGQKVWKVFSQPVLDDLETAGRKAMKETITAADYIEIAGSFIEPTVGIPIKTGTRYLKYITGDSKKKTRAY